MKLPKFLKFLARRPQIAATKTNWLVSRQTAMDSRSRYVGIMEDPDEVLRLAGLNIANAYDEILTDGHLRAVMGSRAAAVNALEWEIIREESRSKVHKMVKKQFENIDMPNFFREILQKNAWGFAPIEVFWKLEAGQYVIKELVGRPARWFRFNDRNEIRFISIVDPINGIAPPPFRLLVARNNPTYDNPYGEKLLSICYWPIIWKRNAIKWWNVFVEKLAIPAIIGKLPANADEDDVTAFLNMLDNMVQDTTMVLPESASVEAFEPSGKGSSSQIYLDLIRNMDAEVSKIWLGQTLTTEIGDVGSYAASQTHAGVKDERRNADVHEIERIINQLIKWMVKLNFGDVPAPEFKMSEPFTVDKTRAETDAILTEKLGVRFDKKYISAEYGIEEARFEIEEPKEEPGPGQETPEGFQFSTPDEKALDAAFTDLDDKELQKQAVQILNPIIELINNSDSYDDALDGLLAQAPKMNLKTAQETIKRAIFASEAWARVNAK